MVVLCSDMLVTGQLRKLQTVWIQEGMTDPVTNWIKLVPVLGLLSMPWVIETRGRALVD